jgi:hypothetical protein
VNGLQFATLTLLIPLTVPWRWLVLWWQAATAPIPFLGTVTASPTGRHRAADNRAVHAQFRQLQAIQEPVVAPVEVAVVEPAVVEDLDRTQPHPIYLIMGAKRAVS